MPPCRICASAQPPRAFRAREMFFGTREEFDYFECAACGSLQIAQIPPDLAPYYPPYYYSFALTRKPERVFWLNFIRRRRAHYLLTGRGLIGRLPTRHRGVWTYVDWFGRAGLSLQSSILEVGAGSGNTLRKLAVLGFAHLTGLDPFIDKDIRYSKNLTIYKKYLPEMTGTFDALFLCHSLEHMPDPLETMRQVARLLDPGGAAVIALPVAGCWAWRTYGPHWYGLDPPRHLVIPSQRAMGILGEKTGLRLDHVIYYSTWEQMVRSELYRRDIPFTQSDGTSNCDLKHDFPRRQMAQFRQQSMTLNAAQDGDQACFIFHKL